MIRRFAGNRRIRLFSTTVIDQAMLSATNFIVSLLLIRFATSLEFGEFVLVQVMIALLVSAQGAWVGGPLSVLAPKKSDEERDRMVAAVNRSLHRFLLRLLPLPVAVAIVGIVFGWWSLPVGALVVAGSFAAWLCLLREFARQALLIRTQPRIMLAADAVYASCFLTGICIALVLPGPTEVWAVVALGLAAAAGGTVARRRLPLAVSSADTEAEHTAFTAMRPLGIWATVGATLYWIQTQSFNYLLAARLAAAEVAHVQAARLLLMPMALLSNGVGGLLVPSAAGWLHREGLPHLVRRLTQMALALLVLDLIYLAVLWLARDWVTDEVMRKHIPDRDLLILLWGAYTIIGMVRDMYQAALLALQRFRPLAGVSALAAGSALVAIWFLVGRFGAAGAIMGIAIGELVSLIGISTLLMQSWRLDRRARLAGATPGSSGTPE